MDRRISEIEDGFERELGAFLGSVNFSGYTDRTRLRSDDLAVRNAAGRYVLEAKQAVGAAISAWWNDAAGEPTRENPFPPAEVSRKLRDLRAFEQSLADMENAVRNASAPDLDAVWNRRSDGATVLQNLVTLDRALLQDARALADAAKAVTKATLADGDARELLAATLQALNGAIDARRQLIAGL